MMKNIPLPVLVLLLLISASLFYFATPYFKDPTFRIENRTDAKVLVTAHWRDKVRVLGVIEAGKEKIFKINDEAAIFFTAKYTDGKKTTSRVMYFSSGMVIHASISRTGISLRN